MSRFDFEQDMALKILIYGKPGTGKTWFACSAVDDERLAPVLVLEAFGNLMSIRRWDVKPDIVTINDIKDFNAPYDWLASGQDPNHPFCVENDLHPPYKTLIVDGLTEVQRFITRKLTGGAVDNPGDLVGKLERQGFGQLLGTMLNWAHHFITLPMNVIMTSLEAERQDGTNGPIRRYPLIWGQSGLEICGYAYLVTRVTSRLAMDKTLLTSPVDPINSDTVTVAMFAETPTYYAKDQYALGVIHMTNPTLGKVLDLIERSE